MINKQTKTQRKSFIDSDTALKLLINRLEEQPFYTRFTFYSLLKDDLHCIQPKRRSAVSYHFNNTVRKMKNVIEVPECNNPKTYIKVPTQYIESLNKYQSSYYQPIVKEDVNDSSIDFIEVGLS
ncbi:hypothetical protein [Macrococcus equi]|uniref:hypothetical protein n=1 Tax=Macrococcus equi TaxID=3395462 RepID=UPI0039BDD546